MDNVIIRMAKVADAEGILAVYGPYITQTAITFETEIPDIDDFRKRISSVSSEYPYIVCLVDGCIAGYAYAHRQMERAAYQWNASLSVYVAEDHFGRGIGKALYSALLKILELQRIQNVYAGVTRPNSRSEKLHKSFNFELLGIYHNTGYKNGRWHDVSWFEKRIGNQGTPPLPYIKIGQIDKKAIADILCASCGMIGTGGRDR